MAGLAVGAAIGGGVLSAFGQIAGGIQQDRLARIAAEEADRDAELVKKQAAFAAKQSRTQGEAIIARGIAITGASGVKVNRGSGLRAQEVDQARVEESVSNILFSGRVSARRLRAQGAILRHQGKVAKISGFLGATSSLLSTVSTVGGIQSNQAIASALKSKSVNTTSGIN